MSTNESTSQKPDVYQRVTSQIINAIEAGVGNWRMPWHTSGRFAFSPINVTSRKPYRGINTVCLWAAAQAKQYESGEWGTYQQWQERGGQVRKGEKATLVVFWKFANDASESDDGEETPRAGSRLLFTRGYSVFNAAQVDGYNTKPDADKPIEQRIEQAEQFFAGINARVIHQGNRAFYSPADDTITLPPFGAFFTAMDYYSTRGHETGHYADSQVMPNRFVISLAGLEYRHDLLGIILLFRGRLAGRYQPDLSMAPMSLRARGPMPIACTREEEAGEGQAMIAANMREGAGGIGACSSAPVVLELAFMTGECTAAGLRTGVSSRQIRRVIGVQNRLKTRGTTAVLNRR